MSGARERDRRRALSQRGLARGMAPRGLARVRPVVATALFLCLAFAVMVVSNPVQVVVLLAVVLLLLKGADRLKAAASYMRVALYAGAFLLVINPLLVPGGTHVLWAARSGPFAINLTVEGLVFGAGQFLRLFALIMVFSLYSVVLDPDEQLGLMGRLSFRSGLIASIATRLFPVLTRDARAIADAQRSRGIELDVGSRRRRVAARMPLLSALVTQSLERACDVAAAMETRGYGRPARTVWRRERRWRAADVLLAVFTGAMFALLVAALFGGGLSYDYFPKLGSMGAALADPWWIALLGLLVVVVLVVSFDGLKRCLRSPR